MECLNCFFNLHSLFPCPLPISLIQNSFKKEEEVKGLGKEAVAVRLEALGGMSTALEGMVHSPAARDRMAAAARDPMEAEVKGLGKEAAAADLEMKILTLAPS